MVLTRANKEVLKLEIKEKPVNKHQEISDYELERQRNIKEKLDFLATLGVSQIKEEIIANDNKKKKERVFRLKKSKSNIPLRRSLRVKKLPAEIVDIIPNEVLYYEHGVRKDANLTFAASCLNYDDKSKDEFLQQFKSQINSNNNSTKNSVKDYKFITQPDVKLDDQFIKDLKSLKIKEYHARKVVPERIYSIAWSTGQTPLFFAGDKIGSLGIFNTTIEDFDQQVLTLQPHNRPIFWLNMPSQNFSHIYSSSYDCSLRRGDLSKLVFEEVYSTPSEDDNLCKGFDFLDPYGHTFLVAQQDGTVALADIRSRGKVGQNLFRCSNRSLRSLQVHPQNVNQFLTGSPDSFACIWDLRCMKGSSHLSTPIAKMSNMKGIHSACYSPLTCSKVLTLSIDDNIRVFDITSFSDCDSKVSQTPVTMEVPWHAQIPHNNHVGRWLTNFRATWHPRYENYFIVGAMKQPRQVEVYSTSGYHAYTLTSPLLTSITSLNQFHPTLNMLGGGNSSGKAFIFSS